MRTVLIHIFHQSGLQSENEIRYDVEFTLGGSFSTGRTLPRPLKVSENEEAYCFVYDRVRVDDATPWIALFTFFQIFPAKNPV